MGPLWGFHEDGNQWPGVPSQSHGKGRRGHLRPGTPEGAVITQAGIQKRDSSFSAPFLAFFLSLE